MTREEKCKLVIEKGYTYNPENGKIFGVKGNEIFRTNGRGYIQLCFYHDKKLYYLQGHQLAWYWVNKTIVDCLDHKDGNKLNNRINNLRSITQQKNLFNMKVKGISFVKKRNKWRARINVNNNEIFLGYYDTEEEARQVYLDAKLIYHVI